MKTSPASALLLGVFLIFLQAGCDKPAASGGTAVSDGPSATIRQLFGLIQEGKVDDAVKLCSDKITQDKNVVHRKGDERTNRHYEANGTHV